MELSRARAVRKQACRIERSKRWSDEYDVGGAFLPDSLSYRSGQSSLECMRPNYIHAELVVRSSDADVRVPTWRRGREVGISPRPAFRRFVKFSRRHNPAKASPWPRGIAQRPAAQREVLNRSHGALQKSAEIGWFEHQGSSDRGAENCSGALLRRRRRVCQSQGLHDRVVQRRTNFRNFVVFARGIYAIGE